MNEYVDEAALDGLELDNAALDEYSRFLLTVLNLTVVHLTVQPSQLKHLSRLDIKRYE